jgi:phage/plasmid primase-like uncharacterized protein
MSLSLPTTSPALPAANPGAWVAHALEIARALLGPENRRLSRASEARWGRRGSLSLDPARGIWRCHETGAGGGILDLVVHAGAAGDRRAAADWLRRAGWLNHAVDTLRSVPTAGAPAVDTANAARRRQAARAIWQAAGAIDRTDGHAYLTQARAIPADLALRSRNLRAHPTVPIRPLAPDGRVGPALVARAQAPDGTSIGVHITWLAPGGTNKAAGTARKMLGEGFGGASVRLGDGSDVVVAEGIESALSAAHALNLSPVAALSAGGVAAWRPWPGLLRIVFAPDRDPSGVGERAARAAADRLTRAGWTVDGFALPPPPHCDWNDAACAAAEGGAS